MKTRRPTTRAGSLVFGLPKGERRGLGYANEYLSLPGLYMRLGEVVKNAPARFSFAPPHFFFSNPNFEL